MINLSNIPRNKTFLIKFLHDTNVDTVAKLGQLGFAVGEKVTCLRYAPFFKDPILFKVGDGQIALSKFEASLIEVEEVL